METKTREDDQKQRDKVCANVSKYKRNIIDNIQKIQAIRPDVSQTYLFETDLKNTRTNPVVCKTIGKSKGLGVASTSSGIRVSSVSGTSERGDDVIDTENALDNEADGLAEENPGTGPSESVIRTEKSRLSGKLCYVCMTKVGPDNSKRIGTYL